MKILCINCKPDFSYFTERGLNISPTFITDETKFKLKSLYKVKNSQGKMVDLYTPDVESYIENRYSGYTIILVGYSPNHYGAEIKNTGGFSYPNKLKNGVWIATVRVDDKPSNQYPMHEMMHLLGYIINMDFGDHVPKDFMDMTPVKGKWLPYYKNDYKSKDPFSNFNQTWENYKPFLSKLNALDMAKYKYFSEKEIQGLRPELVEMLDKARGIAGIPFKINSGFRTKEKNDEVGGVENSAHTLGLAVDLVCMTSNERFRIIQALLEAGFKRIGTGKTFIHCDVDKSKPQDMIWLYN